jgi:hypothetical protein
MLLIQPIAAADPAWLLLLLLACWLPRSYCQLQQKTHHHQLLLRLQTAALQQEQMTLQLMPQLLSCRPLLLQTALPAAWLQLPQQQ